MITLNPDTPTASLWRALGLSLFFNLCADNENKNGSHYQ